MDFPQAVRKGLIERYADFSGRSSRSEYWYFFLFCTLVAICAFVLDTAFAVYSGRGDFISPLYVIVSIVLFLPSLAVAVRRFHDIDKSGWWYLFNFIPLIGWAFIIMWMCTPGTPGRNEYGENPLGASSARTPSRLGQPAMGRASEPRTSLARGWLVSAVLPSGIVVRQELPASGTITLGRSREADMQVDDKSVSRLHAQIETRGGRIYVTDLGSTNGTFVGRSEISSQPSAWEEGDTLRVGAVKLSLSRA